MPNETTTPPPAPTTAPAPTVPAPAPPTIGRIVYYRFTVDGVLRSRPAIVVDVVNPADPFPRLDLHVFARPEELPRAFVPTVAWSGDMLAGTWAWPPRA